MKFYTLFLLTIYSLTRGFSQETYSVESQTKGLSFAVSVGRLGWSSVELDAHYEDGFFYGLQAGYGINHQWAIFLQTNFASIVSVLHQGFPNYPFFEANLGPRYYFGSNTEKWRPFLGAHLNYTSHMEPIADLDNGTFPNLRFVAFGGGLSAGIHYFFNSQLSVFGILQGTYGKSNKIYLDDYLQDVSYTFTSIGYGISVSYHFSD